MYPLQIDNPRERALVRLADTLLAPVSWRRPTLRPIERILLLRLERIGDLLMTLEAIADVRRAWPSATIDLAVGSWNAEVAALVAGVNAIHTADVPWLSRGERHTSWMALGRAAAEWRRRRYDLVINFEPDIRSNLLAWRTGAPCRVGYASGGGGALLTHIGTYDPSRHVAVNARRLVADIAPVAAADGHVPTRRLEPRPADVDVLRAQFDKARRPLIGLHVSGGRPSKQWHLERFAQVARGLGTTTGGTVVLTGAASDVPLVHEVMAQLTDVQAISTAGTLSLPETAALADLLDVLVTGDTGPMHLAAAVGTPVVALFGPSDPVRYGPRAMTERILRVQLPCSPCGQVRLPPERCRGHVPDCMDGITVDAVVDATLDLLSTAPTRAKADREC